MRDLQETGPGETLLDEKLRDFIRLVWKEEGNDEDEVGLALRNVFVVNDFECWINPMDLNEWRNMMLFSIVLYWSLDLGAQLLLY